MLAAQQNGWLRCTTTCGMRWSIWTRACRSSFAKCRLDVSGGELKHTKPLTLKPILLIYSAIYIYIYTYIQFYSFHSYNMRNSFCSMLMSMFSSGLPKNSSVSRLRRRLETGNTRNRNHLTNGCWLGCWKQATSLAELKALCKRMESYLKVRRK